MAVVVAGEAGLRYDAMDAQMAADLVSMARPVTKWATRVVDSSSLLRVLRRAVKVAATPPAGPVFVSLPADVLDAESDELPLATPSLSTAVAPGSDQIRRLAGLLCEAERPMMIVGDGVAASGTQPELRRVAELLGAQVWGAHSSVVNFAFDHPQFGGLLGHMFGQDRARIVNRADALLICATYVFPEVYPALDGALPAGARIAHVDLNPYEIAKNFPVDLGIVADPKATLAALASELEATMSPGQRAAAAGRVRRLGDTKRAREAAEREAVLKLVEHRGPVDRSHRKLAHRGSYTGTVFVSPSTVLRVSENTRSACPERRPGRPDPRRCSPRSPGNAAASGSGTPPTSNAPNGLPTPSSTSSPATGSVAC